MRRVVAVVGLLWATANLLTAYAFLVGGLAAKTAAKGLVQQGLLLAGGLLIGLFALFLVWQCLRLVLAGEAPEAGERRPPPTG